MTAQNQHSKKSDKPQPTISVDHTENYWVRDPSTPARRNAAGRGLFSALQDMKRYNVERGWAKRHYEDESQGTSGGILSWLWRR